MLFIVFVNVDCVCVVTIVCYHVTITCVLVVAFCVSDIVLCVCYCVFVCMSFLFVCLLVCLLACLCMCVFVYVGVVTPTQHICRFNTQYFHNHNIYNSVLIRTYYRSTSPPGGNQVDGLPPALSLRSTLCTTVVHFVLQLIRI